MAETLVQLLKQRKTAAENSGETPDAPGTLVAFLKRSRDQEAPRPATLVDTLRPRHTAAIANKIVNTLDAMWDRNSELAQQYTQRYENRDSLGFSSTYVSDTDAWTANITEHQDASTADAAWIKKQLDAYQPYLDDDWVTAVNDSLSQLDTNYSIMQDTARQDADFFSKFIPTPEQASAGDTAESLYESWRTNNFYEQKYQGSTYTQLMDILSIMEQGEEKDWLTAYAPTVMTAEDYDNEVATAQAEIEAAQTLINDYENALKNIGYGAIVEGLAEDLSKEYNGRSGAKDFIKRKEAQIKRLEAEKNAYVKGAVGVEGSENYDPDFINISTQRLYAIPTIQDLAEYELLTNQDTWTYNDAGELVDFFGNVLDTSVRDQWGNIVNPAALDGKYDTTDRVGIYLAGSRENPTGTFDKTLPVGTLWSTIQNEGDEKHWDSLSEEELSTYYYYLNQGGWEAAETYLDSIQEQLNRRYGIARGEAMNGQFFKQLAFQVEVGLDQFESAMHGLENFILGEDKYVPITSTQFANSAVMKDLENIDLLWYDFAQGAWKEQNIFGRSLGQVMANSTSTTANMLPSILTAAVTSVIATPAAGSAVGAAITAAQVAGAGYQEMINLGYDIGQARAYGAMTGAAEGVLSYALGAIPGLSSGNGIFSTASKKLLDRIDNAMGRVAVKLGANMLDEGLEEGLQEILTPWIQNLVGGIDDGVDWTEVGYSGLLGAISANLLGGPSIVAREVDTYTTGKRALKSGMTAHQIQNIGLTFPTGTEVRSLAEKIPKNTGPYTLGRLLNEIDANITAQNKADIADYLYQKGYSGSDADVIVDTFAAVVEGRTFTPKQAAILEANELLTQAYVDLILDPASSVHQRNFSRPQSAPDKAAQPAPQTDPVQTVPADGAIRQTSAEQAVTPTKITSIQDGKVMVEAEDGRQLPVENVQFKSQEEALLWEIVSQIQNITPEAANTIIHAAQYTEGNLSAYLTAAAEVFQRGYQNKPAAGKYTAALSDAQRDVIYTAGQQAATNTGGKFPVQETNIGALSAKAYNALWHKKPIAASKKDWAKVSSARMQRYASIAEGDIPEIDSFSIAEYNKLNLGYIYTVHNYGKDSYTIIQKKQIKPDLSKIAKEEESSYATNRAGKKTGTRTVSEGSRPGTGISSTDQLGNGRELSENDGSPLQGGESVPDMASEQIHPDRRSRGISTEQTPQQLANPTDYDNTINRGGSVYDPGQAQPQRNKQQSSPGGFAGEIGTRAENADRSGIQEILGKAGTRFPEMRIPPSGGLSSNPEGFNKGDFSVPAAGSPLHTAQTAFQSQYGIDCHIVKASAWTRAAPAFSYKGRVYISENIDPDTRAMVLPHETTHVMKQRSYKPYTDFIQQTPLLLNLQGKASLKLLDMAASHRGIDLNDIDEAQFINLYDELNAIVYGMCKGGILENGQYDYGAWIPSAFTDFEGYIQELDRIHEQFRSQFGRMRGNLESAVAQYDERNALLDPGVQRQLAELGDKADLNGGERLVLDVFRRRTGEIASLQARLWEQQDILAKMQKQGASALQQIPTKNRIKLLTHKLAREQKVFLSLESSPSMQEMLEKLRQTQNPEIAEIPDSSKSVENNSQKDVENIRTYVRINEEGDDAPSSTNRADETNSADRSAEPDSDQADNVVTITLSKSRYPQTAQHILDAIRAGHPEVLTIDREGAAANRRASLKGKEKVPKHDLDEYPPAMFKEGGAGASVRPISPSDNRGAGSVIGHQLRGYPNGTKIRIKLTD